MEKWGSIMSRTPEVEFPEVKGVTGALSSLSLFPAPAQLSDSRQLNTLLTDIAFGRQDIAEKKLNSTQSY